MMMPSEEPPDCIGYMRLSDDIGDLEIRQLEHRLRSAAQLAGMHLISILSEDRPGCYSVLHDLIDEFRRTPTTCLMVPSLDHISTHPLIQAQLIARLERHGTHLWVTGRERPA